MLNEKLRCRYCGRWVATKNGKYSRHVTDCEADVRKAVERGQRNLYDPEYDDRAKSTTGIVHAVKVADGHLHTRCGIDLVLSDKINKYIPATCKRCLKKS